MQAVAPALAPVTATARPGVPDNVALELALWESVKNSQRSTELQAYLTRFPDGTFAAVARGRLDELRAAAPDQTRPAALPTPAAGPAPAKTPPETAVVVAKASPEAPVTAARPTPQVLPSESAIGTLVLTDTMTGIKRNLEVSVQESNAEKTAYSTGDVIGKDGRVLQVRVGDAVLRLVSGAMWTIPLKAGSTGEAGIKRVDVGYESAGTLTWKAVALREGKVQIEAQITYRFFGVATFFSSSHGTWLATYSTGLPLPESSSATIRSLEAGGSNLASAELKLR